MSSTQRSLFMPLYGYYPSDPRVRKEVHELLRLNIDVHIICLNQDGADLPPHVFVHPLMRHVLSRQRESVPNLIFFWILCFIFFLKQGPGLIIHAHDLTALPPAALAKFFHFCSILIYDSHEFFPDAARTELGFVFGFFFFTLEKICVLFIDLFVGISPFQRDLFYRRYHKSMIVLPNYPTLKEIDNLRSLPPLKFPVDGFVILAHGTVRKDRCYFELVDAFKLIQDSGLNFHLLIIGDGPDKIAVDEQIKANNLTNVHSIGKLPFSDTFRYLMGSDAAIGLSDFTIPNMYGSSNKLYEYIAADIPAAYSNHPGSRIQLTKAHFIPVNSYTAKSIYQSILKLKNSDPSLYRNNLTLIKDFYNWEKACARLVALYSQVFHITLN